MISQLQGHRLGMVGLVSKVIASAIYSKELLDLVMIRMEPNLLCHKLRSSGRG